MNDIIIVGNGPSLLERDMGEKINSFTHVVRFNGYKLKGYEKHVGSRTTIWSRWHSLPVNRPLEELDEVWLNIPAHQQTNALIQKAVNLLPAQFREKSRVIPNKELGQKLVKSLYSNKHNKWPSSGALAIAHCVDSDYDVTITGIDSWAKPPYHYYGEHDRSNSHHERAPEKDYIDQLVGSGRIKVL